MFSEEGTVMMGEEIGETSVWTVQGRGKMSITRGHVRKST